MLKMTTLKISASCTSLVIKNERNDTGDNSDHYRRSANSLFSNDQFSSPEIHLILTDANGTQAKCQPTTDRLLTVRPREISGRYALWRYGY